MREFNIGDKVIVHGEYEHETFNRDIGIIVAIHPAHKHVYGIEFNRILQNGHTCYDKGKQDHCYFVHSSIFTPYMTKLKLKKLLED